MSRFVRTITNVKDIKQLSDRLTNNNDIITDVSGDVYLKNGTNHYIKLSTGETESLQSEITSLKSQNTKLKNRVTDLETSNTDLIKRVETLENADTTT